MNQPTQRPPTNLRMILTLYALRHRPTGLWIPDRRGKGGTFDEPAATSRPRLFPSLTSANCFLAQWLKGKHVRWAGQSGSFEGITEYDDEIRIQPVPTRRREEMEVVEFRAVEQMWDEALNAPKAPKPAKGARLWLKK